MSGKGLYANIHAKRKRIAAGRKMGGGMIKKKGYAMGGKVGMRKKGYKRGGKVKK